MPKRSPLLSRADVIAQLRRLDAAVDAPLKVLELPNGLRLAVQRHFGTMDAAREAARIEKLDLSRRCVVSCDHFSGVRNSILAARAAASSVPK